MKRKLTLKVSNWSNFQIWKLKFPSKLKKFPVDIGMDWPPKLPFPLVTVLLYYRWIDFNPFVSPQLEIRTFNLKLWSKLKCQCSSNFIILLSQTSLADTAQHKDRFFSKMIASFTYVLPRYINFMSTKKLTQSFTYLYYYYSLCFLGTV